MNKKAQVMDNLGALAVGIATFTIIMVVAFLVIGNTKTQVESIAQNTSAAYNATVTLQSTAATVPGWIPLIVIVVIGAAILGMIKMFRR